MKIASSRSKGSVKKTGEILFKIFGRKEEMCRDRGLTEE
jgi:hypothetical protein